MNTGNKIHACSSATITLCGLYLGIGNDISCLPMWEENELVTDKKVTCINCLNKLRKENSEANSTRRGSDPKRTRKI